MISSVTDEIYIGVSSPVGTSTAGFSINGSRPGANDWTVDGADNVDRESNQTLLNYPSVDAIAAFNLLRGQYDPEFGRAQALPRHCVTVHRKLRGRLFTTGTGTQGFAVTFWSVLVTVN